LNGGVCRITDASDDGTQSSGLVYRCECEPDYEGDFCEAISTAKEKEILQGKSIAAATSVKQISVGEYFGIMLGVGLAIGIIGGALIVSRRNNARHSNSLDTTIIDANNRSPMNPTMTMSDENTTGQANRNCDVESFNDNEII
jgi:hypothetical protein